jgi:FMN phosphatase YigB (HAD superfamily)
MEASSARSWDAAALHPLTTTPADDSPVDDEAPSRLPPVRAPLRRRLPSGERLVLERADKDPRRIDAVAMILDDVLYDHTGQLAHFAIDRGIAQLLAERAFPTNAAAFEALQTFRDAYGYRKRFPRFVDHLVAQRRLAQDQAARVIAAYYASKIPEARSIKPFAKARETLLALQDAGYRLGLVLVGKREVQLERLRALGVEELFSETVFLDANPSVDALTRAMKKLGRRLMLQPSSILFVGRKAFYEIKAANRAGLVTVRTVREALAPLVLRMRTNPLRCVTSSSASTATSCRRMRWRSPTTRCVGLTAFHGIREDFSHIAEQRWT